MSGPSGGRGGRPSGGRPSGGRSSSGGRSRRDRGRTTPASPGRGARGGPGPTRAPRRPAVAASRSTPGADERPSSKGGAEQQRSRRRGLTGRAAILALVLAALVVSYASSLRAWSEQQSRLAELRAEETERSARVVELEKELERWHDPAYVEAQARQRFGWVMPGEVGYVVVGADESGRPPAAGEPRPGKAHQPAWWSGLWGSVEKAAEPPATTSKPVKPKPATTIDPDSTPGPSKPPTDR